MNLDELTFNPQILVGDFDYRNTRITMLPFESTVLLPPNPNRIVASFSVGGGFVAAVCNIRPPEDFEDGWLIGQDPGIFFFYRDWGAMVGGEWFGFDDGGGAFFNVCEVIYTPNREG